MTVEELQVVISAKTQGLNQQIAGVNRQISGLENTVSRSTSKMSGLFSKLGKAAIAAFSVKAIVDFGKQAVSVASDLQEVENVVVTAFGGMSAEVEKWSKTTVDKFGMSELSAKRTASTYMAMSKGLGLAGEQAADMAMKVAERTGDIASFYNMSQQESDTMMKSIWTGETESLKRIGVVMTQTNLDAFALANGFGKTTDAMTQSELVMLRYRYVMEQTSLAAGDFEKTSGSWANQTRVLSERFKELLGVLGSGLLQVLTPVVQFLNMVLSKLVQAATLAGQVVKAMFGGGTDNAQNIKKGAQGAADSMESLAANTKEAGKAAKGALAGFDELNVLAKGTQDVPEINALSGIPAAAAGPSIGNIDTTAAESAAKRIEKAWSRLLSSIKSRFAPSISAWSDAFEKLKGPAIAAADTIWSSLNNLWSNTLLPFGEYIADEFVPAISNSFSETFAPIFGEMIPVLMEEFAKDFDFSCAQIDRVSKDILLPSFEHIKTVATDVFSGIKASWDEHGQGILDGFRQFRESLRVLWDSVYTSVVKPVFDRISGTVSWLWDEHIKPFWDNLVDFFGSLTEFLMALWNNVLAPVVDFVVTVVGPVISAVVGSIGDIVGTVYGMIADVIGGVLKSLSGLLDFLTGVFTGDWEKAWNGIKKFFQGIWDAIWGIVKGSINLIIDGLNMLWGGVYSVVSGIVNGVGGIADAIGKIFGQDWSFSMPAEPPLIPKLASGGLAYGPTLAMIGEGMDHEAVLPLNQGVYAEIAKGISGQQNTHQIVELLSRLLQAVLELDTTMELDGITFARAIRPYTEREAGRRGGSLIHVY